MTHSKLWHHGPRPEFVSRALIALWFSCVVISAGCSKPQPTVSSQPTSSIRVSTAAAAITIETPVSRFALTSSGYLQASLIKDGKVLSLDSAKATNKPQSSSLDLGAAKVSDANGKLGSRGKRVEVTGTNGNLKQTLALEVYDDFPAVVIVSSA